MQLELYLDLDFSIFEKNTRPVCVNKHGQCENIAYNCLILFSNCPSTPSAQLAETRWETLNLTSITRNFVTFN